MTDREINTLVAEKVMGWEYGQTGDDYSGWVGAPHGSRARRGHFEPWSDIADAWQVVERLKYRNGDCGSLDFDLIYTMHEGWGPVGGPGCEIVPPDRRWFAQFGDADTGSAHADTAPKAICLAALERVGVRLEEVPA